MKRATWRDWMQAAGVVLFFLALVHLLPAAPLQPPATIPAAAEWEYFYQVKEVAAPYDGDTIELTLSLGCEVFSVERVRLYGINTPERKNETLEAGNASRDHLAELTSRERGPFVFLSVKDRKEKYGRRLGWIYDRDGQCVNLLMLKDGFAVEAPWE